MKILLKHFFYVTSIFLVISCDNGKNSSPTNGYTKDKKEFDDSNQRDKVSRKKDQPNSNYWSLLSAELNIGQDKISRIIDLNQKNNVAIEDLRNEKPTDLFEQIKGIRILEKKEIEKILGAELYKKKLTFDKKWEANRANSKNDKK